MLYVDKLIKRRKAKQQLEECNYDCNVALNKYFGIKEKEPVKQNVNQTIYSEIRNMMDTVLEILELNKKKQSIFRKCKNKCSKDKKKENNKHKK